MDVTYLQSCYFPMHTDCCVVRLSSTAVCCHFVDYIPSCTLTIVYSWIPYVLPQVKTNAKSRRPFNHSLSVVPNSGIVGGTRCAVIPNIERMRSYSMCQSYEQGNIVKI